MSDTQNIKDFLSCISREFRTPMNAIVGLTELQRQNMQSEKPDFALEQEYSRKLKDAAYHLQSIVKDLQDISDLENGTSVVHPERTDLQELLDTIGIRFGKLTKEKKIQFQYRSFLLQQREYWMDGSRVSQILNDLFEQIIDRIPSGGSVSLKIELQDSRSESILIRFLIFSDELELTEEFVKKLFHPYESDKTYNSILYNCGLGMSPARRFARLMGGDLAVITKPDGKKMLSFYINAKKEGMIQHKEQMQQDQMFLTENMQKLNKYRMPIREQDEKDWDFTGTRVLLCEDQPINNMVVVRLLENKGCKVDSAMNGRSGVDMFCMSEEYIYDLVILDIRMPVMDGLEAAKKIRQLERQDAKTIPIIALSANVCEEDIKKSLEAGMNYHLTKPIETQELYSVIQKCMTQIEHHKTAM